MYCNVGLNMAVSFFNPKPFHCKLFQRTLRNILIKKVHFKVYFNFQSTDE